MKTISKSYKTHSAHNLPTSRPTMTTLLYRIAASALSGGMLWLMFFGGMLIVFLHINHFPADSLLVLMIFAALIIAFFRGIRAWQDDLDEYQRDLTEYRMNMTENRIKRQVKEDIVWNRH
jgi:membrane protein implicated in regulation of membrane protease activity